MIRIGDYVKLKVGETTNNKERPFSIIFSNNTDNYTFKYTIIEQIVGKYRNTIVVIPKDPTLAYWKIDREIIYDYGINKILLYQKALYVYDGFYETLKTCCLCAKV